jgi:hypothetical protein
MASTSETDKTAAAATDDSSIDQLHEKVRTLAAVIKHQTAWLSQLSDPAAITEQVSYIAERQAELAQTESKLLECKPVSEKDHKILTRLQRRALRRQMAELGIRELGAKMHTFTGGGANDAAAEKMTDEEKKQKMMKEVERLAPMLTEAHVRFYNYRTSSVCRECGKSEVTSQDNLKLRRCSKCLCAAYCSAECQQKNWPKHKPDCITSTALLQIPCLRCKQTSHLRKAEQAVWTHNEQQPVDPKLGPPPRDFLCNKCHNECAVVITPQHGPLTYDHRVVGVSDDYYQMFADKQAQASRCWNCGLHAKMLHRRAPCTCHKCKRGFWCSPACYEADRTNHGLMCTYPKVWFLVLDPVQRV